MNPIRFRLNGRPVEAQVRADKTVLEWLRAQPELRGTKEGCAEGDCGACSVLLAKPGSGEPDYQAANSCIMLMGQIEGCSMITVEGLNESRANLHPAQAHMAENGSSQCGFCTPGIAISLAGLLEKTAEPEETRIHDALAGNLCRCTGYRPIVEAATSAAAESAGILTRTFSKVTPQAETAALVGDEGSIFLRPSSVEELCSMRGEYLDAVLLAGGTDLGIGVAQGDERWPIAIVTSSVEAMKMIEQQDDTLVFGGAVTWEQALPWFAETYPSFATLVRRFGSTQVRSMGTIGGNIANASPIGDGPPALMALGASVVLASVQGKRQVMLDAFFTGYRQSVMTADEVIAEIRLPLPADGQHFRVYKISKRYDQDISTVCGAFSVVMNGDVVGDARIAFGGMAATSQRCLEAEQALIGQRLDATAAGRIAALVTDHFSPLSDWRGSAEYRIKVAANLCQRFVRDIAGEQVEVMAL